MFPQTTKSIFLSLSLSLACAHIAHACVHTHITYFQFEDVNFSLSIHTQQALQGGNLRKLGGVCMSVLILRFGEKLWPPSQLVYFFF